MSRPSMEDYIDMAERIRQFKEAHPDGSLQTVDWGFKEVAGKWFVYYHAAAYRTPDDERPGHGIAWEPFPGPTAFTKDSELMNSETSAWGRAIVACGFATKKIASKQEVQARQPEVKAQPQPFSEMVSAEDIAELRAAAKGLTPDQVKLVFTACAIPIPEKMTWSVVPKAKAPLVISALGEVERT